MAPGEPTAVWSSTEAAPSLGSPAIGVALCDKLEDEHAGIVQCATSTYSLLAKADFLSHYRSLPTPVHVTVFDPASAKWQRLAVAIQIVCQH